MNPDKLIFSSGSSRNIIRGFIIVDTVSLGHCRIWFMVLWTQSTSYSISILLIAWLVQPTLVRVAPEQFSLF
jgi:hypothetical protein